MRKIITNLKLITLAVAILAAAAACSKETEEPTPPGDDNEQTPGDERSPDEEPEPEPEPEPELTLDLNYIPDEDVEITEIPKGYYFRKLAPMPLPSTLKSIGNSAFYACENTFLVIPEGVETIGKSAFAIGHSNTHSWSDYIYTVGNLKWLYLPSTVKNIGKEAMLGHRYWDDGINHYTNNPNVVITASTIPEGFFDAIFLKDGWMSDIFTPIIYVPESNYDIYFEARNNWFGNDYDDPEVTAQYIKGYQKSLPVYSYKPVDVTVSIENNNNIWKSSFAETAGNIGEITAAEWDTSDHDIAEIASDGTLTLKTEGKTYVQCIVSTTASNGEDIKFYFFKPIQVISEIPGK